MRFIIFILFFFTLFSCKESELESISSYLDYLIENKHIYEQKKENEIKAHREMFKTPNLSLKQQYDVNQLLYNDFLKYKVDSAIYYIEKNLAIAKYLNCDSLILDSKLTLVPLYSSIGCYLEAEEVLKDVHKESLTQQELEKYYSMYSTFYYHYSQTNYINKYEKLSAMYSDSVAMVQQKRDPESLYSRIKDCIAHKDYDSAEKLYIEMLDNENGYTYNYASIANSIGDFHNRLGNTEKAKKYFTLSAIADIINCKKENASFKSLAVLYQKECDLSKAFRYTQSAIDDASSSKYQFRSVQLSRLYSLINVLYQKEQAKAKATMKSYIILISILTFVLSLLIIYVYIQMRKASKIKTEISMVNDRLTRLNDDLNDSNNRLQEANMVKEQYIVQFFDLCSTYIDKIEDNRKTMYKLATNKKFDELIKYLKSSSSQETETEELYRNFDTVFLALYPTFVTDFNSLLHPNEQIVLKNEDLLNRELRIYALLRLGITDSYKIASFLRCSISTVYNYRTRARNKAAISREEFEDKVMTIGSIKS